MKLSYFGKVPLALYFVDKLLTLPRIDGESRKTEFHLTDWGIVE